MMVEAMLVAIRRVMRAVDLHSRQLARRHGLTGPQAVVLREVSRSGGITAGELARRVSLSKATITDIVARLEKRSLLRRLRDSQDRRKVIVRPTANGVHLVEDAVPLLQETFSKRFAGLDPAEQRQLLAAMQRVAELMDARRIDAAPLLTSGAVTATAEQIVQALSHGPDRE
jgi:DNA-binding MarR family transcriptional regulator